MLAPHYRLKAYSKSNWINAQRKSPRRRPTKYVHGSIELKSTLAGRVTL